MASVRLAIFALLVAQPVLSARIGTSAELAEAGPKDEELPGVYHKTLKMFKSWKDDENELMSTPAPFLRLLQRKGLTKAYTNLINQVTTAGKGRFGNWKASEIYRVMYVAGHEKKFAEQGIAIFLSKRDLLGGFSAGSTLKLFFVDRQAQEHYEPPDVYKDAHEVVTHNYAGGVQSVKKVMPEGVAARTFDDKIIKTDKQSMPVNILKLLEKTGTLGKHMDFGGNVWVHGNTWFTAAIEAYKLRTEKLKDTGLAMYFCRTEQGNNGTVDAHSWIEYVDTKVNPTYVPKEAYPDEKIVAHLQCQAGDPSAWYSVSANKAMQIIGARKKEYLTCSSLAVGGVPRDYKYDDDEGISCKCPRDDQALFCGTQEVHDRKFRVKTLVGLPGCGAAKNSACWSLLGQVDKNNNDCNWYIGRKGWCGEFDTASFRASKRCCSCNGGLRTQKATVENVAYCARTKCLPPGA